MAKPRVRAVTGVYDVELSPSTKALVTPDYVFLAKGADVFRMTRREAEVLAAVTGAADIDPNKRRSG